jgi:hypothetical protein
MGARKCFFIKELFFLTGNKLESTRCLMLIINGLGDFMKWKQTGNRLETNRKQSGINWKQKNVSSCFQLFPVYVSSKNPLILRFLRICFQCFHFFKRAYIGFYIFSFGVWFYSAPRNYKSLAIQGFREKALKIEFQVHFYTLKRILLPNNRSLKFGTFPGMLRLTPFPLNAILKP